ncbi:MAG: hypothetical protein WC980_02515 [Candidatus Brocadiia bacterium]
MPLYFAGMDEAGYGPVLGPLVLSAVIFELPESFDRLGKTTNLWECLPMTNSAGNFAKHAQTYLPVCDSKKMFQPSKGIGMLERSVLSFARMLTANPFESYSDLCLPLKARSDRVDALSAVLRKELDKKGIRFRDVFIKVVDAEEFNKCVRECGNKSDFLFHIASGIMKRICSEYSGKGKLRIAIGKQGGRTYYHSALQEVFSDCAVSNVKETRNTSVYRFADDDIEISFLKDGEDRDFFIALASMFGKYTREMEMIRFNRLFIDRFPQIKPTAGYPTDARRFIRDVTPLAEKIGLEMDKFIRIK